MLILSGLLAFTFSACGGGGAGLIAAVGSVTGQVINLDTNGLVAGALVRHSSGSPSTTTGADGRYTLSNVPAGLQTLAASASGLPPVQRQISVPAQGTATLNFGLTHFGNPAVVGPSGYLGGVVTINIISQGQSSIFAATIAPRTTDGGAYTLQALGLSFGPPSQAVRGPTTAPVVPFSTVDTVSLRLRQLEQEMAARLPRGFSVPQSPVQEQVGSQATFWVFINSTTFQQVQITATLQAESAHGQLYVDNQDLGTIPAPRVASLLQSWEAEIFPRVTQVFGLPQNPFNTTGQGRVTLLYSRTVAQFGVGGYFSSTDLYLESLTFPPYHSNQRDMLYISPSSTDVFAKGTMAHEFQHLINFSQHVFQLAGPMEVIWINEGLSMVAEDIAGYGFQVGNTTPFASSFMTAPGSVSLWGWTNTPADYGAAWLFFRYLGDKFGNQVLTKLVQTSLTGAANIELQTGETIGQVIGEEALAILNIAFNIGLSMPYTYASITSANLGGAPTLTPSGSASIMSGGYQFYGFSKDPTLPAARITIQAGTATPWVGVW
jgi:hypothetical protein